MNIDPNLIKDDFCDWLRSHNVQLPVTDYVNDKINLVCSTGYFKFDKFNDFSELVRKERLRDLVGLLIECHKVAFEFHLVSSNSYRWHPVPHSQPYYYNMYRGHLWSMNQLKALSLRFDLMP